MPMMATRKDAKMTPSWMFERVGDDEQQHRHQHDDDEDLERAAQPGPLPHVDVDVGGEGAGQGDEHGADERDPAALVEVDQAAGLVGDRAEHPDEEHERGDAEDAQPTGRAHPRRPPQQQHAEDDGEDAEHHGVELDAGRVEADRDVAEDAVVERPRQQPADDHQGAADDGERRALRGVLDARLVRETELAHARSTTFAPRMPCGRKTRTRMRRPKAQTSFHGLPPKVPGMNCTAIASTMPEGQAADDGAPDVADAAEDGGGERLQAGEEAHPEVDVGDLQALRDTGDGGEGGADGERDHDDPVDVDAHQAGGVGVLRDGLHAAAGLGAVDEVPQARGAHEQAADGEQGRALDRHAADLEGRAGDDGDLRERRRAAWRPGSRRTASCRRRAARPPGGTPRCRSP